MKDLHDPAELERSSSRVKEIDVSAQPNSSSQVPLYTRMQHLPLLLDVDSHGIGTVMTFCRRSSSPSTALPPRYDFSSSGAAPFQTANDYPNQANATMGKFQSSQAQ